MDPQHVRYFLAVIDHGSINAAANALGVSQPTISQGLRSLERDLKTPVFYRIGRGMVPTSAGHALVGPARRILRDMATAAGSVPDVGGNLRGRVDLRVHPVSISGMVPRVIAEFHHRQPQVRVTIDAMHDEAGVATLLHDAVCEIVVAHLSAADTGLTTLRLGTQVYDLALPPAAGSPRLATMSWEEIDEAMVVAPQHTTHAQRMIEALTPRQQARPPAAVLENREARLTFCLAGIGPTWIDSAVREDALRRGARVRVMQAEIATPYGLIYQEETLSPAARAFVDVAAEMAGATPQTSEGTNAPRNADAAGES